MPVETSDAIDWALKQTVTTPYGNTFQVTTKTHGELVEFVRIYFNEHDIEYNTYCYTDLIPYFPENRQ